MNELRGPLLLAALSGVLLFAAFPPVDFGFLGWVALVPLLVGLHRVPAALAWRLGAVTGTVAFFPLMAWMRVFGILAWVLIAAYLAAYVGMFAALYRWIASGRRPGVDIWGAALSWVTLEYLRSVGMTAFPWALLGLTQHAVPPVLQSASYGGVFAVSFLLALASAAAAHFVTRRTLRDLVLPALLIAVAVGLGVRHLGRPASPPALRAAAVQPNVNPREKFDLRLAPEYMRALRSLVVSAGEGADLIVLPETAIPYNLFGTGGVLHEVGEWAHQAGATLVATSLEDGRSNIAVSIAPSGQALSRYDKVRLVAFGEYGLIPGRRHDPLWTPSGRIGIAVCFESIFPDVARALVRNGAEVLGVITNDGWFNGTAGVAQHAAHSVLRAVETGRSVVRAANTGLTMIIDPEGRVQTSLPPRTAGVLEARVALVRGETFYTRWGDLFAQIVCAALLFLAAPRVRDAVAADWRLATFQQAIATIVLPLVSLYPLLGSPVRWAWPALLLTFVILFSVTRPPGAWGLRLRGAAGTMMMGTAVVAVLWGGALLAFRAYDLPTAIPVPSNGWTAGILQQLLAALAVETWLRGIVFAPLREWQGGLAAVALPTVLGLVVQRGLGPEAIAWALITGVLFGVIRMRTGNVTGLVLPHALGNFLFSMVTVVR